eukprot:sb/3470153/
MLGRGFNGATHGKFSGKREGSGIDNQEPTETSKQPIKTRYFGHVTGYQPIRDQHFLIWSLGKPRSLFLNSSFHPCLGFLSSSQTFSNTNPRHLVTSLRDVTIYCPLFSHHSHQSCSHSHSPPHPYHSDSDLVRLHHLSARLCIEESPLPWQWEYQQGFLPGGWTSLGWHYPMNPSALKTNQSSLFRSCDWLSANQGPVFPVPRPHLLDVAF